MYGLIILLFAAVALTLPGLFLVLRNMAMLGDALSHTVLLGIVLGFFIAPDLNSPVLILTASVFSVLTVSLIEYLNQKAGIAGDASIGIVFPFFFALGVILLSRYLRNVHLDLDCVIMGDLTFADLVRTEIFGISVPSSLVSLAIVLIFNIFLITLFFKELKLSSFDPLMATLAGFHNQLLNFGLSLMVAVSAVVSFEIVGAILVIAFLVIPASFALLFTRSLGQAIVYSLLYALVTGSVSYALSWYFNLNAAGLTAAIMGFVYVLAFAYHQYRNSVKSDRRQFAKPSA
ncbi:MAG: metal ABC transporter permease [Eubacteriales bacterium]|nr:metal ABC transporter permease [Eubacteriales bacterium]